MIIWIEQTTIIGGTGVLFVYTRLLNCLQLLTGIDGIRNQVDNHRSNLSNRLIIHRWWLPARSKANEERPSSSSISQGYLEAACTS